MHDLRAAAANHADTRVAGVAWCGIGGWRGSPRPSAFVQGA